MVDQLVDIYCIRLPEQSTERIYEPSCTGLSDGVVGLDLLGGIGVQLTAHYSDIRATF